MRPLKKPLLDPSWLLFIDFQGFPTISWDFMDFHGLHGFLRISWNSIDFEVRGYQRYPTLSNVCHRDAAPKETFARSQLAAIHRFSWISIAGCYSSIFIDFHRFRGPGLLYFHGFHALTGWLADWLAGGLEEDRFPWISDVFQRFHRIFWGSHGFHGFRGPRLRTLSNVCCRDAAPKETFARSQLAAIHRFSWISDDFMRFHGFPRITWISEDFINFYRFRGPRLPTLSNVCHRDAAPKETFTRSQLAVISSIFIDFRRFHEISWISTDYMDFWGFHGFL